MTAVLDEDLLLRGTRALLASWEAYANWSPGAAVVRLAGVTAAVFPNDPERSVYNNAVLAPDLGRSERTDALDAMESTYASAAVGRFAAWVHETDGAMRTDLLARGYRIDTAARAMAWPSRTSTALTALLVRAAAARGCRTASPQSTEMAERVYGAVGFRHLGRIIEHVPPGAG